MNRLMTCLCLIVSTVAILGATTQAQGGVGNFYYGFNMENNPDLSGGQSLAWGNAQNAVTTSVMTSFSFDIDEQNGSAFVYSHMTFSGYFGDPTINDPYYEFMQTEGLQYSVSFDSNTDMVMFNGNMYTLDGTLLLSGGNTASLVLPPIQEGETQTMIGFFSGGVYAQGAVALSTNSALSIQDSGPVTNWQLDFHTTFLYTGGVTLVPAPGTLVFVGLAGLLSKRRRS